MGKINISDVIAFLMVGTVAGAGLMYAGLTYGGGNDGFDSYPELAKAAEARMILEEAGVGFDSKKAIDGYVKGGLDSFSGYTASGAEDFSVDEYVNNSGTAVASGFRIKKAEDGGILLRSVEENKAAYVSGLREGDEIVSVNGTDIISTGYDDTASLLLGKQDTVCELVVVREGEKHNISFKRDNAPVTDLTWENLNGIGFIKFRYAGGITEEMISEALSELKDAKGYILDLRSDQPEDPEVCASILRFLAPGQQLLCVSNNGDMDFLSKEPADPALKGNVVLMINRNTSRCSEVITAAVKNINPDAVIVGERSSGEASYQKSVDLPSGGQVYYTAGTFHIEGIEDWNGKGIQPDKEVLMDPAKIGTDDDIQIKEAIEILD